MNKPVKFLVYDSILDGLFANSPKLVCGQLVSVFPNTFFGTSDNHDSHAAVLITSSESYQYLSGRFYTVHLSELTIVN
jgi:hypothetical protein